MPVGPRPKVLDVGNAHIRDVRCVGIISNRPLADHARQEHLVLVPVPGMICCGFQGNLGLVKPVPEDNGFAQALLVLAERLDVSFLEEASNPPQQLFLSEGGGSVRVGNVLGHVEQKAEMVVPTVNNGLTIHVVENVAVLPGFLFPFDLHDAERGVCNPPAEQQTGIEILDKVQDLALPLWTFIFDRT